MSKTTEDGGPAFPDDHNMLTEGEHGMSLRDWFAGQALTGLLAGQETQKPDNAAQYAFEYADAMLERRKAVRQ